jgi:hypothetical protein
MKKIIITGLAALLLANNPSTAQNNLGKSDDLARISLAAYVPDQIESLPDIARNLLSDKLNQLVTQNGMGGSAFNERFIITANISVLSKDLTTSSPSMTVLTLSISFYIGDGIEGTKFASSNIVAKGVGETETKAYISAIRNINVSNPELKSFTENGKNKIIQYYNSKCDFLIKNAQTLSSAEKYDEAIYELTKVPEVCKECYTKAMDQVIPIYKKQIDRQCLSELSRAKSVWAAGQNTEAATQVADILAKISPNASCFPEVQKFVGIVGKRIYQLDQREWSFTLKVQQDVVDIQKASIRAARDIGVAYGNHQQPVVYNIKTWW